MTRNGDLANPSNRTLSAAIHHILRTPLPSRLAVALAGVTVFGMPVRADQLEEIVVSATRRDTTTADIPYSISAISAKSLEDNHVTSLADLTKQIAGVSF